MVIVARTGRSQERQVRSAVMLLLGVSKKGPHKKHVAESLSSTISRRSGRPEGSARPRDRGAGADREPPLDLADQPLVVEPAARRRPREVEDRLAVRRGRLVPRVDPDRPREHRLAEVAPQDL